MKKINIIKQFALFIIFILTIDCAFAQVTDKLEVGDPAPPLKYAKWIKGEPIKELDANKTYVLEFWATWCGPCKANMPHLTELQKKYKDQVTIIGVGAMEHLEKGKPYESTLPMVEAFVKGNTENMGYSVIADNNDQHMTNKWFKPSGEMGIPVAFVVKNNKVIWIGHPAQMDPVLAKVVDGTYNVQAFKDENAKRAEASKLRAAEKTAALKPINDAIAAKNFKSALTLIDKLSVDKPDYKNELDRMKFKLLSDNFSQEEMIGFGKEWSKTGTMALYTIITEISGKEGLSKETYLWAANNFMNAGPNGNPFMLDMVAKSFVKGGDIKSAIPPLEKAAQIGRAALTDPKLAGAITEEVVVEYESRLKTYKSLIK